MHTQPPEPPESPRPLRIVVFDEPGGPIPDRPHIGFARKARPVEPLRIALASSGLLDQLGQTLPVEAPVKPLLHLVRPEAVPPPAPVEPSAPKLKIVAPRRRRKRVRPAEDDPEGAA